MSPKSQDCDWNVEGTKSKLLDLKLSISVSICYFVVYFLITLVISIYALFCKASLFKDTNYPIKNTHKTSLFIKCKPYLKCYTLALLHFAIQSINIGVIIQLYFISLSNCAHNIPVSSLNIQILFLSSLATLILYRIISAFKIYAMTHNKCESLIQFLFDYCIIKALYVDLVKHTNNICYGTHYTRISYCFQWFLRIHSYFYAAPMAFIQCVMVLLYLHFTEQNTVNLYYLPILISLFLCFIDVIAVAFESDSIVFNPHKFNLCKIWLCRLCFRIFDISARLLSMALFWVTVGGYFVTMLLFCEFLYIFIACIRLQLVHRGLLRHKRGNSNNPMSPSSNVQSSKRGKVRISNEYKDREYIYRPNSIGRLTMGRTPSIENIIDSSPKSTTAATHISAMEIESKNSLESNGKMSAAHSHCSLCGTMIFQVLDYYLKGMIVVLISFKLEDRSSLFSMWFWRYRVCFNLAIMSVISVFGFVNVYCENLCFWTHSYDKSFIALNENDYYIGFVLFVYAWFAALMLPLLLVYLGNGKIKTDKYSPQSLKDIMINGDVIGIFEMEMFGLFVSKHLNKTHAYTLTGCNLEWTELDSHVLMQYLYVLKYARVDFSEIYDPFDSVSHNLVTQLCANAKDCYHWFQMTEITDLLKMDGNDQNCTAVCCQSGNFRIFKSLVAYFGGNEYLQKNKIIALHYAFRCRGSAVQQRQANRIIVYVLKNAKLTIDEFLEEYEQIYSYDRSETKMVQRIVQSKRSEIEALLLLHSHSHQSNNHSSNGGDRAELLQAQLSNNSIPSIQIDKDSNDEELELTGLK